MERSVFLVEDDAALRGMLAAHLETVLALADDKIGDRAMERVQKGAFSRTAITEAFDEVLEDAQSGLGAGAEA